MQARFFFQESSHIYIDADRQESDLARVPCLTGGAMASADRTYNDVKKNPALISMTTAKEKNCSL